MDLTQNGTVKIVHGRYGCYVIHLDYTILPLTDVIHSYLYVVQTHFLFMCS